MKILDFLFRKETQSKPEEVYDFDAERKLRIERETAEREAWEHKNELAKKHDACNLGMTKTAFNGTYDELKAIEYRKSIVYLQSFGNSQAQMQGMNVYHNQNCLGNIFGL